MKKRSNILIAQLFMLLFMAKMVISIAPVIVAEFDKDVAKAVIMQLEYETHSDTESGKTIKIVDHNKAFYSNAYSCELSVFSLASDNDFIAHYSRYVNLYFPRVPTPPPNVA